MQIQSHVKLRHQRTPSLTGKSNKEALISQSDETVREKLRQYLETIKQSEKGTDWLRELVEWIIQEMLSLEFNENLGAEPTERSEERKRYRNGYFQRELLTRVGRLTLRVPRDREGHFYTELFERYQRSAGPKVSRKARREVHAGLRDVFNAPNLERALGGVNYRMDEWQDRFKPDIINNAIMLWTCTNMCKEIVNPLKQCQLICV